MPYVFKAKRNVDPLDSAGKGLTPNEKKLIRQYLEALKRQNLQVNDPEVIRRVMIDVLAGNPKSAANKIPWEDFTASISPIVTTMATQVAISANLNLKRLPKLIRYDTKFDLTDPRAIGWAQSRAGATIRQINEYSRDAVSKIIQDGLRSKLDPDEVRKAIQRVVGLDSRQATALETFYRKSIEEGTLKGLSLQESIARAENLGVRYRNRLWSQRAERIARTELAESANQGRYMSWMEAEELGIMPPDSKKRWLIAQDERTCPICVAVNGEIVDWDATFSTGKLMPTAHVNCRCTAILIPGVPSAVIKHKSHDQSSHGRRTTAGLQAQAKQFNTFEEFSSAISQGGLRPKAWHITDEGFELDPNRKPTDRIGGKTQDPGLFVGDPEYWQEYATGRETVVEYDMTGLTWTKSPLGDTNADFFSDQSGNQGFFVRPKGFGELKEVGRFSLAEAIARAQQQQSEMPNSKEAAKKLWDSVNKVFKHGSHDQSKHGRKGSKGGGKGVSGLDAMPYKWDPKLQESTMTDEEFKQNSETLEIIAESPVSTYLYGSELDLIVKEGRFKSLDEIPVQNENLVMASEEYRQGRVELENDLWGVPRSGVQPIYGYMDTNIENHNLGAGIYGDVKVTLKDNVSGRTTFTAGDSLNSTLIPVRISDIRAGTASRSAIAASYTSQKSETYRFESELKSPARYPYFEAQVHGGVSLKDIKSVSISQYSRVDPGTISTLTELGVEVVRLNDNR